MKRADLEKLPLLPEEAPLKMDTKDLETIRQFLFDLTGSPPESLSHYVYKGDPFCYEVSSWDNAERERYHAIEKSYSYAWIYDISAFGVKLRLYISKLDVSIAELMDDPSPLEEMDDIRLSNHGVMIAKSLKEDLSIFEKSMVIV